MSLELKPVILQKDLNKSISLKSLLDKTKRVERLFYKYTGTYIDHLISSKDLENVTDYSYFLCNAKNIKKIELNVTAATTLYYAFATMESIEEIHLTSTKNVKNFAYTFSNCPKLHTITGLDLISNEYNIDSAFMNCPSLTNLSIKNIKHTTKLASTSGTAWGQNISVESLINTCKECINVGAARTLTIGTTNISKLSNTYVRLIEEPEIDESNPKLPCEVCNSTTSGAILISDYLALKNWTLA